MLLRKRTLLHKRGWIQAWARARAAAMVKARIFREGKSPGQSGRARAAQWVLQYESAHPTRPEPLMGWAGGADTDAQVQLRFPSLEAARDYAARQGLEVEVVPPPAERLIIQAYADNFK